VVTKRDFEPLSYTFRQVGEVGEVGEAGGENSFFFVLSSLPSDS